MSARNSPVNAFVSSTDTCCRLFPFNQVKSANPKGDGVLPVLQIDATVAFEVSGFEDESGCCAETLADPASATVNINPVAFTGRRLDLVIWSPSWREQVRNRAQDSGIEHLRGARRTDQTGVPECGDRRCQRRLRNRRCVHLLRARSESSHLRERCQDRDLILTSLRDRRGSSHASRRHLQSSSPRRSRSEYRRASRLSVPGWYHR